MAKRSNFKRKASDLYRTPMSAVLPLLPHLNPQTRFAEPCAANGQLVDHLQRVGHTAHHTSDKVPGRGDVVQMDALGLELTDKPMRPISHIITNPPWDRKLLHPMIDLFSAMRPTWLLFDADWIHTKQSSAFTPYLRKVVSIGRVKWIPDSKMTGKDNCAWHLFDKSLPPRPYVEFYGRTS